MSRPLRVLIADADGAARSALRIALSALASRVPTRVVGEVSDGVAALEVMGHEAVDVLLMEVAMPRMSGIELARHLAGREGRPAVVLMSHADAARAPQFAALGIDLLIKPPDPQRLMTALLNARKLPGEASENLRPLQHGPRHYLSCVERGKIRLVNVDDISYLRAELKYVTARTPARDYLLDVSLTQLEQEYRDRFLRVHRNCLVARKWIAGFERAHDAQGEPHWMVKLQGTAERLPVSRRQWPLVRGMGGVGLAS